MKGGYKIIDLQDVNLVTGTASKIAGIHDAIENNYRKATLVSGIIIDGLEKADRFVAFENAGGDYVGILYEATTNAKTYLTITDADEVTVQVTES